MLSAAQSITYSITLLMFTRRLVTRGNFALAFQPTRNNGSCNIIRSCSIVTQARNHAMATSYYNHLLMDKQQFSSLKSTTESQATKNSILEDDNEYDWNKILPFQKNNHNSIKIVVPDEEEEQTSNKDDLYDANTFHNKLEATIATAEQLHKSAIWITIPISRARLMEEASKSGFVFHHAEGHTATLNKWLLDDVESRIPTYATHQVGVGAVVINAAKNEILCVRERRNNYRPWKIPGGLAELGEDLDTAVIREVYEETGIHCGFLSVLGVRHFHGAQFGRSDLYFVCRLEPIPINEEGDVPTPVPQEGEIEATCWVDFNEYRDMVNSEDPQVGHPMMKQIMKIVEQSEQNDIQKTIVSSVVPGRKPSPVYHAPIQSESKSS
jgi:ADP-ribose pyrophosphatase YjhB (NUDIX family)